MNKYHFSKKFYFGVLLIICSLVLGKITTITFFLYFGDAALRWLSLVVYLLTWIPFVIGAWWIGQEYTKSVQKYFSYAYYHQGIKVGARKALVGTRERAKGLREKAVVLQRKVGSKFGKK